jgi:hypothetical protein
MSGLEYILHGEPCDVPADAVAWRGGRSQQLRSVAGGWRGVLRLRRRNMFARGASPHASRMRNEPCPIETKYRKGISRSENKHSSSVEEARIARREPRKSNGHIPPPLNGHIRARTRASRPQVGGRPLPPLAHACTQKKSVNLSRKVHGLRLRSEKSSRLVEIPPFCRQVTREEDRAR